MGGRFAEDSLWMQDKENNLELTRRISPCQTVLGEKTSSYSAMALNTTVLTSLASHAHWYKRGRTVVGITNWFLIGYKVCSMGKMSGTVNCSKSYDKGDHRP